MMTQDRQGRRVYQVSQVGMESQDSQEDLVSLEPKVNQVLLELDHPDNLDPRYRTQPMKFPTSENFKFRFTLYLCLLIG